MRLCLSSDIHGNVKATSYLVKSAELLGCTAILVAGDLCAWEDYKSYFRVVAELSKFRGKVIAVLGNSDYPELLGASRAEAQPLGGAETDEKGRAQSAVSLLHGDCLVFGGVRFVGASGVPEGAHGSYFSTSEDQLLGLLRGALERCDPISKENANVSDNANGIIITSSSSNSSSDAGNRTNLGPDAKSTAPLVSMTHPPPLGVLDTTYAGDHAGSSAILEFIKEVQPALHVCGHIHEAKGVAKVGKTVVVNPGPPKRGDPIYVAEVRQGEVTVELVTLDAKRLSGRST